MIKMPDRLPPLRPLHRPLPPRRPLLPPLRSRHPRNVPNHRDSLVIVSQPLLSNYLRARALAIIRKDRVPLCRCSNNDDDDDDDDDGDGDDDGGGGGDGGDDDDIDFDDSAADNSVAGDAVEAEEAGYDIVDRVPAEGVIRLTRRDPLPHRSHSSQDPPKNA